MSIWETTDDDVMASEASDNIWVNWRDTCECILRHTSNILFPCVTTWWNQTKSANISGRELWISTSLVHLVQFPDSWRCHVQLFKQLYASIWHGGVSGWSVFPVKGPLSCGSGPAQVYRHSLCCQSLKIVQVFSKDMQQQNKLWSPDKVKHRELYCSPYPKPAPLCRTELSNMYIIF